MWHLKFWNAKQQTNDKGVASHLSVSIPTVKIAIINCQTNLLIILHELSLLFCNFINTSAIHLGIDKSLKISMAGGVVVVKWSACSPSILTIRVRIPLKCSVFFYKLFEKNENKQKRGRGWPIFLKRAPWPLVHIFGLGVKSEMRPPDWNVNNRHDVCNERKLNHDIVALAVGKIDKTRSQEMTRRVREC